MTQPTVTWTQRHGYSDEYEWVETSPDTTERGLVLAYVAVEGVVHAVIQQSGQLLTRPLDDLTVVENET